jgi:Fe2+ or Zn2+ uptake regulation protein
MKDKDKKLILKALRNYDLATKSQSIILSALLNIETNYIATITPAKLSALTKIHRPVVYRILKQLERFGFILILKESGNKIGVFELKHEKLEEIKKISLKREVFYKNETKMRQKKLAKILNPI